MGFSEWDTCPKYKLLCLGNNLKKPDTFLFFSNLIAKTWYFLKLPDKKKPDTFWNFSKKPDTLENVQIQKPDKKKTYVVIYTPNKKNIKNKKIKSIYPFNGFHSLYP